MKESDPPRVALDSMNTKPHPEAPADRNAALARATARRLLVVDDDDDLRELLVTRLREEGYQVEQADSAEEAFELVARSTSTAVAPFDLILTDYRMPGWNGIAMISEIRSLGWSAPLLLMTAFPTAELEHMARKHDATLLPKPLHLGLLCAVIAQRLARAR